MKFIVQDRNSVEDGVLVRSSYVLISIRDPASPKVRIPKQSGLRDVLRLAFHDAGAALDDQHTPEIMRAVKAEYVVENDDLNEFIEQHLTADPQAKAGKDEVYQRYRWWCQAVGKQPLNKNNLGTRLAARGWTDHRTGGIRQWNGWTLKPTQGEMNLKAALDSGLNCN